MNADDLELAASDSDYVALAVEMFAMLADQTRVRLILALQQTELSVGELAEVVAKSPAAVSQHLAKLRLARMVATRQEGKRVFYRLANEHAHQLVTDAIFQAEHAVEAQPRPRPLPPRQPPPPRPRRKPPQPLMFPPSTRSRA